MRDRTEYEIRETERESRTFSEIPYGSIFQWKEWPYGYSDPAVKTRVKGGAGWTYLGQGTTTAFGTHVQEAEANTILFSEPVRLITRVVLEVENA